MMNQNVNCTNELNEIELATNKANAERKERMKKYNDTLWFLVVALWHVIGYFITKDVKLLLVAAVGVGVAFVYLFAMRMIELYVEKRK